MATLVSLRARNDPLEIFYLSLFLYRLSGCSYENNQLELTNPRTMSFLFLQKKISINKVRDFVGSLFLVMIPTKSKPLLVFGTRHGTIFNLTPHHLPLLPGIQLSVGDFYDHKDTLQSLPQGMSFKKFLGFKEDIATYLTPYDFYKKQCMTGCDNSNIVKIKCNKGYTSFTAAEYDEVARIIKPEYLVTLTEYPASQKGHTSESNKSHKRAINKTTTYLQKSTLVQSEHGATKVLGAIHGGKNSSLLNRSLQQILNHEVDGFVICDLCDKETIEEREAIYKAIHERLSQANQKQFILSLAGLGKIEDIKHGLKFGISIFEVNYPFLLAEEQKAMIRNIDGTYSEKTPELKKQLTPLDPNCKCYTCSRHSQSYIAHLTACFELNAKILLSIHNIQMYVDFLESLND